MRSSSLKPFKGHRLEALYSAAEGRATSAIIHETRRNRPRTWHWPADPSNIISTILRISAAKEKRQGGRGEGDLTRSDHVQLVQSE